MKKTFQLHLRIETTVIESLRREAQEHNITLAELCRQRLRGNVQLTRIENLIERLYKEMINRGSSRVRV